MQIQAGWSEMICQDQLDGCLFCFQSKLCRAGVVVVCCLACLPGTIQPAVQPASQQSHMECSGEPLERGQSLHTAATVSSARCAELHKARVARLIRREEQTAMYVPVCECRTLNICRRFCLATFKAAV